MRYDLKKFLFIGLQAEQDHFFSIAQEAGVIQFINANPSGSYPASPEIAQLTAAIRVVNALPVLPEDERPVTAALPVAEALLQLKNRAETLTEEARMVRMEISRIAPFGYFSPDEVAATAAETGRIVRYYAVKANSDTVHAGEEGLFFVATDKGLDYYMALDCLDVSRPRMIEMHITTGLAALEERQKSIATELTTLEHEISVYARYRKLFHTGLMAAYDAYHLAIAKQAPAVPQDTALFVVQGWVPENQLAALTKILHSCSVHAEEVIIEEADKVPTCLQNEGYGRIGEDLVQIYDTPSTTDTDPSLWVLGAFALFFAMIIGDGGYGLLFLAAALYIRYKAPNLVGGGARALKLFTILAVASTVFGLMTHSFFGIEFAADSPMRQYSAIYNIAAKKASYCFTEKNAVYEYWIDPSRHPELAGQTDGKAILTAAPDMTDVFYDNIMMECALLFGIIHIWVGMARYVRRNPVTLGWLIFLIGGYLYAPSYLKALSMGNYLLGISPAVSAEIGYAMVAGGIGLATLISIWKNKLSGILEPLTAIQIFADTLSYIRLYALALSGAILTKVIGTMAATASWPAAILLIVVGHTINIVLALMGGVIHGLRLNFIEWYHYSFEGGGRLFEPLKRFIKN